MSKSLAELHVERATFWTPQRELVLLTCREAMQASEDASLQSFVLGQPGAHESG